MQMSVPIQPQVNILPQHLRRDEKKTKGRCVADSTSLDLPDFFQSFLSHCGDLIAMQYQNGTFRTFIFSIFFCNIQTYLFRSQNGISAGEVLVTQTSLLGKRQNSPPKEVFGKKQKHTQASPLKPDTPEKKKTDYSFEESAAVCVRS